MQIQVDEIKMLADSRIQTLSYGEDVCKDVGIDVACTWFPFAEHRLGLLKSSCIAEPLWV